VHIGAGIPCACAVRCLQCCICHRCHAGTPFLLGCFALLACFAFPAKPAPQIVTPLPLPPCSKHQCFSCWPGAAGCKPVSDYKRLVVGEHGRVAGRDNMMAEIFARGPISCGIDATSGLDEYDVSLFCRGGKDAVIASESPMLSCFSKPHSTVGVDPHPPSNAIRIKIAMPIRSMRARVCMAIRRAESSPNTTPRPPSII
jgi:hypothetical protein